MATYVNDLRLKEIATGDEAGTWGTSTNTNLELIAEAFSYGTEAITTNADTHTTTIADGSTDPGRSLYLKYTGTLDSACTITLGPNTVSKMWFIENATTGSQNIIISQGSGANVTIPPGDVKVVYSDGAGSGAAVVDAFASLSVVDLKVQDDLTVTDDLIVNGDIDLEGNMDVNGSLETDALSLNGTTVTSTAAEINLLDGSSANTVVNSKAVIYGSSGQVAGTLSTAAQPNITSLGTLTTLTVDDITINGSTISDAGDLTLDVAGDITLDAANAGSIEFHNAGTLYGQFYEAGSSFHIRSRISDGDIIFQGNDGGSTITALTLNMSAAGAATFNAGGTFNSTLLVNNSSSINTILRGGDGNSKNLIFQKQTGNTEQAKINAIGDELTIYTGSGSTERASFSATEAVFNDSSEDTDFRVESNGNSHMLFVDAGNDAVGIGTSTPGAYYSGAEQLVVAKASGEAGITVATASDTNGALYFADGTTGAEAYQGGIGYQHANSKLFFVESGVATCFLGPTEYVFNEPGLDRDFRVESNDTSHMLFVDGGNSRVGIGIEPSAHLHVRKNAGLDTTVELLRLDCGDTTHVGGKGGKIKFTDISVYNSTAEIIARREGVSGGSHLEFTLRDAKRLGIYSTGNFELFPAAGGHAVFNQDGNDVDFRVESNNNQYMLFVDGGSDAVRIGHTAAVYSGGEKMTILATGTEGLGIQTTSASKQCIGLYNSDTSGTRVYVRFAIGSGGTEIGSITSTGSTTAYNTSSDARLKDVTGSARGLEVINELNPVSYNWKEDGKADEGLIAQEVLDIVPNAVSGSEEDMYQMDYSKLVVHLVAGMKEQQAQIEALQSEINLLKGE